MRLVVSLALAGLVAAGTLAAAGTADAQPTSDRTTTTHRVVVRPVDQHGRAVAGWTVTRETGTTVTCDGAAPAAVDRGIRICYPAAVYTPACWASRHHTVLCLRDATVKKLVRLRYSGTLSAVARPRHPVPQDLVLARGQHCSLRIGGAWAQLPTHKTWSGYYSCTHGSIYGPTPGDGIDAQTQPWTVHLWKSGTKHRVVTREVRTAYYVGTHH